MPKAPTSSFEAEKSVRKVQPDVSPEKWRKLGPAEPWGHALFFLGRWESESVGGSKWWRVKMANLFAAFCSQLLKSPAGPCHGHEVEISDELTADSKSRGLNMYVTYVLVGFFSLQRHCKGTERERERERGKFYTDLTMESVFCNFFLTEIGWGHDRLCLLTASWLPSAKKPFDEVPKVAYKTCFGA